LEGPADRSNVFGEDSHLKSRSNKTLQPTFAAGTQPVGPQNAHRPQVQLNAIVKPTKRDMVKSSYKKGVPLPAFPEEVYDYVRAAFASANERVSENFIFAPNSHEESFDHSFVETIGRYRAPRVVLPGWAVRMDVHFLGGMRHFHGWEIADIGVLIFFTENGKITSQKVALLQSKRLYPKSHEVIETNAEHYRIGFGNLLPSGSVVPSLMRPHKYEVDSNSRYGAMSVGSNQYNAIEDYIDKSSVPVHYLMYNPWTVPSTFTTPTSDDTILGDIGNGGARVVSASLLHESLKSQPNGYNPRFTDTGTPMMDGASESNGYRLENFIADQLLKCKEGLLFSDLEDGDIYALFNRRSGSIYSALSITIERNGD